MTKVLSLVFRTNQLTILPQESSPQWRMTRSSNSLSLTLPPKPQARRAKPYAAKNSPRLLCKYLPSTYIARFLKYSKTFTGTACSLQLSNASPITSPSPASGYSYFNAANASTRARRLVISAPLTSSNTFARSSTPKTISASLSVISILSYGIEPSFLKMIANCETSNGLVLISLSNL